MDGPPFFTAADERAASTVLHKQKNIIPLLLCLKGPTDMWIVMPLKRGSLQQLIPLSNSRGEHNDIPTVLLRQMLSALAYLDSQGLCHRDVKPANILFDHSSGRQERRGAGGAAGASRQYSFYLADFGLANAADRARTLCGTSIYMAPEMFENRRQTPKVDVWSLFVTFAVVLGVLREPDLQANMSPRGPGYWGVVRAVLAAAASTSGRHGLNSLEPMARSDPSARASAKTMLDAYSGRPRPRQHERHGGTPNGPIPARPVAPCPNHAHGQPMVGLPMGYHAGPVLEIAHECAHPPGPGHHHHHHHCPRHMPPPPHLVAEPVPVVLDQGLACGVQHYPAAWPVWPGPPGPPVYPFYAPHG